jgi:hypothetical protein
MKRFIKEWSSAKEFKKGTLLLVNWHYGTHNEIDELLLLQNGKEFITIGSSDSEDGISQGKDWKWSCIPTVFKNIRRITTREDLLLCMHLYKSKKFEQVLKGEIECFLT